MRKKPTTPVRGRPPKSPADKASRILTIKLTPAQHEALVGAAGDELLAVWAREQLLRLARRLVG